jgi:Domain of unknown function (DUF4037)
VTGAALARRLYDEHLASAVAVPHAAAFLGWGSDVLGYDDERSQDHGFGPRLQLFVDAADVPAVADAVERALPEEVDGYPTRFGWDDVPVAHRVYVTTLAEWLDMRLGFDATAGVSTLDWLLTPQQRLLEVTAGAVFADDGRLGAVRAELAWYSDDVWLWILASQWRRVAQEEAFPGRAAERGDELGSRLVAARIARDLVGLCFLLERRYAPYAKWLGTAFAGLDSAAEVGPALEAALAATAWEEREDALVAAYEAVARRQVALTPGPEPSVRRYFTRPFRVIGGDRFAEACLERVADARLRSLPLVGAVDQAAGAADVLHPLRWRSLAVLYPGID